MTENDDIRVPGTPYLVGGFVRDRLLQTNTVSQPDRDWVVVGATPEAMIAAGFTQVDSKFPVFIHPKTREEYALARTEVKAGTGHRGFQIEFNDRVTLRDDLARRDLTINAIAQDANGKVSDPFGGRRDLERKVLRHVSKAFTDDPLRVFRVARFTAILPEFQVAPSTLKLMRSMVEELDSLSAERVWAEVIKAMQGYTPYRFYYTLLDAQLVDPWFSGLAIEELADLLKYRWLRDVDALAAVGWIHDERTAIEFLRRLKAPGKIIRLVKDVARFGNSLCTAESRSAHEILDMLAAAYAFRPGVAFQRLIDSVRSLSGNELTFITELVTRIQQVRVAATTPVEYKRLLTEARIRAVDQFLTSYEDY